MKINLNNRKKFAKRHIGPDEQQLNTMLKTIGANSLDDLIYQTVPNSIRLEKPLNLPEPKSEYVFLNEFRKLASQNKVFKSYIGQGYYNCITPTVIVRNILENPGWYTAYTPYQAEIAQGRLEMLLNFQTMVTDLTGMEIANASLLDEATAAAEAMTLLFNVKKADKKNSNVFIVSPQAFKQTIEVITTRAIPIGIEVRVEEPNENLLSDPAVFGILLQYPDARGEVIDIKDLIQAAKKNNVLTTIASDLLALTMLVPPGEMGADVVVGTSQRFGVPLGFGGPHAGFFATKEEFKRQLPGRIIGVSIDANGQKAYRMALQTREQHIRREKATSNICTSQVLLAVISAAYTLYHGSEGLKAIGQRVHGLTSLLSKSLSEAGFKQLNKNFFDTIRIELHGKTDALKAIAEKAGMNFWYENESVQLSIDETTQIEDLEAIITVFNQLNGKDGSQKLDPFAELALEKHLLRNSNFMEHEVFNSYHSEHEMLRYLKYLENKDLSLVHSMISLGSCTMKLNATTEMLPVTWPEFSQIHPFAPESQVPGYKKLISDLENWLSEITGFSGVSLQPNSGAQGEYAGLLVIKAFHEYRGQADRNIALIPSSAHGTNPASAVLAGYKVVVVKCDEKGNVELQDLKNKVIEHGKSIAVLMITYPSTHGVFEESVKEICHLVHSVGAQVYMDGANMNAQVGLTSPGFIGADVCHLNLHKTFCIPHGGGGPGMGPIAVADHLKPFLSGHPIVKTGGDRSHGSVSAAPYGSASILPISYAYISMMGAEGLKDATMYAILNANYLKARLEKFYPVLYAGTNGRCAHEFILDCRNFKSSAGIEVEDIAKRLMDYGFHAPTVSFPVAGTLMVEPTESESLAELDRFCDAMISIREEIREIEAGIAPRENNVLKNAPHTAAVVLAEVWDRSYSREKAAYPIDSVRASKFWPSVGRIDSAYGDRNLICTCLPIESYEKQEPVLES